MREGALGVAGRARVFHYPDDGGRPGAYEMGYMTAHNWYDIHGGAAQSKSADGAYFAYAFWLDALIQFLGLLKGQNVQMRWRFLCGRLRFLVELTFGRHRLGTRTASERA